MQKSHWVLVDLTIGNERIAGDDGMVVVGWALGTAVVGVALEGVGAVAGVEGVAEAAEAAVVVDVGAVEEAAGERDDDVVAEEVQEVAEEEEEYSDWVPSVSGGNRHCQTLACPQGVGTRARKDGRDSAYPFDAGNIPGPHERGHETCTSAEDGLGRAWATHRHWRAAGRTNCSGHDSTRRRPRSRGPAWSAWIGFFRRQADLRTMRAEGPTDCRTREYTAGGGGDGDGDSGGGGGASAWTCRWAEDQSRAGKRSA